MLIATHSPLVTTSFSIEKVKFSEYIDDNGADSYNFFWNEKKYYGWNASSILTEQFEMKSARSREFIDTFNSILESYHKGEWLELKVKMDELEQINFQLPEKDKLFPVYMSIKEIVNLHFQVEK